MLRTLNLARGQVKVRERVNVEAVKKIPIKHDL
jgi:hypothetical protein